MQCEEFTVNDNVNIITPVTQSILNNAYWVCVKKKTKQEITIRATRFNYNNINCMSEKSWKIRQNMFFLRIGYSKYCLTDAHKTGFIMSC